MRSALPVAFGVAVGAATFAVFDQTYSQPEPTSEPAQLTAAPAPVRVCPFRNCDAARRWRGACAAWAARVCALA